MCALGGGNGWLFRAAAGRPGRFATLMTRRRRRRQHQHTFKSRCASGGLWRCMCATPAATADATSTTARSPSAKLARCIAASSVSGQWSTSRKPSVSAPLGPANAAACSRRMLGWPRSCCMHMGLMCMVRLLLAGVCQRRAFGAVARRVGTAHACTQREFRALAATPHTPPSNPTSARAPAPSSWPRAARRRCGRGCPRGAGA